MNNVYTQTISCQHLFGSSIIASTNIKHYRRRNLVYDIQKLFVQSNFSCNLSLF